MIYFFTGLLLIFIILIYFRLADRYNIVDKPNNRSSHSRITIRGGGIIFPIAVLLWYILFGQAYPFFCLGLLLIAIISFLDDRFTLSTRLRLSIQILSVALLFYELGFGQLPWYAWLLGFILVIGWLNAFNFMDGINGITAFYALAVLLPVWYVNRKLVFVDDSLLYTLGLSLLVFAFFNARKKAKTFAGDVGSVSMGLALAFVWIALYLKTQEWAYILFVAVYGIDAILTIVQRLLRGENIFKAHRSHLYQYLANEKQWPHLRVSSLYAIVQLVISIGVLYGLNCELSSIYYLSELILMGLLYLWIKQRVKKSFS